MKFQRQPINSFGPRQHSPLKKKLPGPRMMKIRKEVQRRHEYMTLSAPYRNTSASKGDDVENIGCVRNGKTNDFSKSVHGNQGGDNIVAIKLRKQPLGEISNGNIFPLGKSKRMVISPTSMVLEKSVPSSLTVDFSSEVVEKISLQVSKDNSSDINKVSKKPLHSSNMLFGKRKVFASSRGLTSSVVKVVASIQGNDVSIRDQFVDEHHKEESFKEKDHKYSSYYKRKGSFGAEDTPQTSDVHQRIEASCMGNNMKKRNGGPLGDNCRTDNDKFKSKRKRPLGKMSREHANGIDGTKTVKRVRRFICNEDGDDINGDEQNVISGDKHNTVGIENGTNGLAVQTATVELYGSLPIDEPIWSGMLKIGSEGHVPLEAHLLAKSCEKVWECSRSLQNMVQVTKLSRLGAEPKCFRESSPTEDNIGLYFFSQGMRPNEDFDKLVKEVMDKDLILRAYVGEAEMLIFPSILLPERHQTFQGKHYLWGLFKRRENSINVEGEERMRCAGTRQSRHERENGRQHSSPPRVGKKDIDEERRSNVSTPSAEGSVAEAATPAPAATRRAECAAAVAATPAPAATSHATSPTCQAERAAAEATNPAAAATTSTPQASSAVPQGGMYGFIVRSNPKIQQLIQEMEREGAMVFVMRGETIGNCLGRQ